MIANMDEIEDLISAELNAIDMTNAVPVDGTARKVIIQEHELRGIKYALRALGYELNLDINPVYVEDGKPSTYSIKAFSKDWKDEHFEVVWKLDDIKSRFEEEFPELEPSESNCRLVAEKIKESHDAENGINWDVIDATISCMNCDDELIRK